MTIVLPVSPTEKADRLQSSVHLQAEVLSAGAARRAAPVWRLNIGLTPPSQGQVGAVGRLELDAITGEVLADDTLAEELIPRAHALTAKPAGALPFDKP